MKIKVLFLLTVIFMSSLSLHAQRGVRIGYIDTEYILQNVPEYQEASSQLDSKVQKWKSEIESRLAGIEKKRTDLSNEKALLTKELISEREEDIDFEEMEIIDYQQKRFGANGDLMIQKKQLMQPVQDQIFGAVQDIAETKKYDFIFDKSADVVMLFSANRFDISDQVLRSITRTSKRTQAQTKAERKAAESEELVPEINEEQEAREKELEEKQTLRATEEEQRRQEILIAREAKKLASERRRDSILAARAQAKEDKLNARNSNTDAAKTETVEKGVNEEDKTSADVNATEEKTREQLIEENRQKKLADREARKKELEERKKKILEERQKAKEEREQNQTNPDQENEGENN